MYKVYNTPKGHVAVSDDEIKRGDWVYNKWSLPKRCVFKVSEINERGYIDVNNYEHLKAYNSLESKKIIASTFDLEGVPTFKCEENRLMSIVKSLGYGDKYIMSSDQEILEEFQNGIKIYEDRHMDLLRRLHHYAFVGVKTIEDYKLQIERYDSLMLFVALGKKKETISEIEFEISDETVKYVVGADNAGGIVYDRKLLVKDNKLTVKNVTYSFDIFSKILR